MPMQMQYSPRHNHVTLRGADSNGIARTAQGVSRSHIEALGGVFPTLVSEAVLSPSTWVNIPGDAFSRRTVRR